MYVHGRKNSAHAGWSSFVFCKNNNLRKFISVRELHTGTHMRVCNIRKIFPILITTPTLILSPTPQIVNKARASNAGIFQQTYRSDGGLWPTASFSKRSHLRIYFFILFSEAHPQPPIPPHAPPLIPHRMGNSFEKTQRKRGKFFLCTTVDFGRVLCVFEIHCIRMLNSRWVFSENFLLTFTAKDAVCVCVCTLTALL